jgi:hypothetical protein
VTAVCHSSTLHKNVHQLANPKGVLCLLSDPDYPSNPPRKSTRRCVNFRGDLLELRRKRKHRRATYGFINEETAE